jgi:hypothetical protein
MTTESVHHPDRAVGVDSRERKSAMERVIETLASFVGNGVGWMAESGILFAIFAVAWVAFGAGLVLSQGSVDQAWAYVQALPLPVQLIVWLLFLPVMIGLWVWESTWPILVRLPVVIALGLWNLWMFLPRAASART